eukprot:jgi/Orpsp1_1/1184524/evm.model.c7180000089881.1
MSATDNTEDITDVNISSTEKMIPQKLKDDKPKKVSYIELFKYSNWTEKIMVFIGILGSIAQGVSMPLMVEVMSDLINIYMKLVASVSIRNLTGVSNNDDLLIEFLNVASTNNVTTIGIFAASHPEIDMSKMSDLSSNNGSTDLASLFIT